MATYGKKGGNTMANAAADVKAMLEGAPGAALHHSGKNHRGQGVFRVRRSILTTSKKEKEKHQNEFMKIFEEQTKAKEKEKKGKKNVNFGESKKKKQEPAKAKRKIRKR